MNRNQFEQTVIGFLPSEQLKNAIKQTGHKFSDIDLIKIICDYAPDHKRRIGMLNAALDIFSDENTREFLNRLTVFYNKSYDKFIDNSGGYIYLISIYENKTPNAMSDEYCAQTFGEVLNIIGMHFAHYYAEEGETVPDTARCKVVKRYMGGYALPSDLAAWRPEDFREMIISADGSVLSFEFDYTLGCDGKDCIDCTKTCLLSYAVRFPHFIDKHALVAYKPEHLPYLFSANELAESNGYAYGIMAVDICDDDDHANIVWLNSPCILDRTAHIKNAEGYYPIYEAHTHVPYAEVKVLSKDDVPPKVYDDYLYAAQTMKKAEAER